MSKVAAGREVGSDVEECLGGEGEGRVEKEATALAVGEDEIEVVARVRFFLVNGPEGVQDKDSQVVKSDQPESFCHDLALDGPRE
jgi:hypothetical protein